MTCRTCNKPIELGRLKWQCRCCGSAFHLDCVTQIEKDNHICFCCEKNAIDDRRAEEQEQIMRMQLEESEEL
jgi:hypothetical protein